MKKTIRLLALALVAVLAVSLFQPVRASAAAGTSQTEVQKCMDDIAAGKRTLDGNTKMAVGETFTGTNSGAQCKGYAVNVWKILWNIHPGSTQKAPSNYLLNSPATVRKVGTLTSMNQTAMKNLFQGARAGDFVQILRSHGGSHSAVVYSVTANGVTMLEANMDGANGVEWNTYTWAQLCKNAGISVYTCASYTAATGAVSPVKSSAAPAQIEAILFDAAFYANIYPDLRAAFGSSGTALKNHWRSNGIREGRVASPFFDAKWYMANNPDVAKAYGATNWAGAYDHFIHYGFNEGRQGSPYFSAAYYLGKYPDLKAAFGSDYLAAAKHFLNHGLKEGRQASAQFSIGAYNAYNPDVVKAFSSPLLRVSHYIAYVQYGSESRRCL